MDINFVRLLFLFNTCTMTIFGTLAIYAQTYVPAFIVRAFYYGKFGNGVRQSTIEKLEIPKKWFKHFYIFAAPACTSSLVLLFYKHFLNGTVPEIVYSLLDMSLSTSRKTLVSSECAFLIITLFTIHCWKRYYETHYVNVFSDKKINIFHYVVGFIHYIGVILSILGESDGFVKDSTRLIALHKLTYRHYAGTIIFLWCTLQQLKSNLILSNLRKSNNKIVSNGYKIPHGGLFEYVSAPLQLTEILIYLASSIILWESSTFHYITTWVIINQVDCAIMTHKWYKETFTNYPKIRKILVPYLY